MAVLRVQKYFYIALLISLIGLFHVAYFGTESTHRHECLSELLRSFGIEALDVSAPTYVRLAKPVPISSICDGLVVSSKSPSVTNLTKLELLTPVEQALMHSIVHGLFVNFTQRNLELFLAGGSLLGSVRHFGLFPWDIDADLMIPASQKARARELLVDLSASDDFAFKDTESVNSHWQLGVHCQALRNMSLSRKYGTGRLYPAKQCMTIVDFFFGTADNSLYKRLEHPFSFPIGDVYPLRLRPYGPYLIPAPRHAESFLTAVYGKDYESKCLFKYFGHRRSLNCADLRSVHPFVTHLRLPDHNGAQLKVDVLVHRDNMLSLFIL